MGFNSGFKGLKQKAEGWTHQL